MDTDRICEENSGLVRCVVNRYFPAHIHDDDFLQEGLIALWEASMKYDAGRGVKFNSYASVFIRRRCVDELRRRNRHDGRAAYSLDEPGIFGESRVEALRDADDEYAALISEIAARQMLDEIRESGGLTETQLNIMSLRIEGQTLKQISKNIGIHMTRVYCGLKAVRQAAKTLAQKY